MTVHREDMGTFEIVIKSLTFKLMIRDFCKKPPPSTCDDSNVARAGFVMDGDGVLTIDTKFPPCPEPT
jgi:hypothetical protein